MQQASEVELLRYRVAELESALGVRPDYVFNRAFKMTPLECSILGLFMKKEVVTREAFFAALYSDTPNTPCGHILNVKITHMRKKLAPHGITINNSFAHGWYIYPEHKKLIRELCA